MKPNGPAIKGGCVTRRQHRAGSRYFSREIVTVQGGPVTSFLSYTSVAVQVWSEPRPDSYRDYPRLQSWKRALAQSRYKHYKSALGAGAKAKSV